MSDEPRFLSKSSVPAYTRANGAKLPHEPEPLGEDDLAASPAR